MAHICEEPPPSWLNAIHAPSCDIRSASSLPYMPDEELVRPSTTTRSSCERSSLRPIAVRGCRSRMSPRSGKQLLASGSAHVIARPSTTSSGNPLTSASVPGLGAGATVPGSHPASPPKLEALFFTQPVWV